MPAATPDDLAILMSQIATGDRDALRQLYQATSSKLFGVCLRILSDKDESEDVLQEVYDTTVSYTHLTLPTSYSV